MTISNHQSKLDGQNSADTITKEIDLDDKLLEELGYKQELYRGFSSFMNFSFCFTAVAVISSLSGLFETGMATGGPALLFWSWIIGGALNIIVALCLAEICSTYPSAGSVYHWAGSLASHKWAPLLSYITGWFNFLGNAAGDAFFAYSFSGMVNSVYQIYYPDDSLSVPALVAVAVAVCCLWAIQNALRIDKTGWFNNFATFYQIFTMFFIIITLFVTCSTSGIPLATPNQMVFTYYNGTGLEGDGFAVTLYVTLLGTLTTLYSFTGYEAAGHLAEETHGAQKSAPQGIYYCALASFVVGLSYLIGLLSATASDVAGFVENELTITNIFQNCSGFSLGVTLAILLVVNMYFSGMSSMTVTTRISFAMARDGAFPFSEKIRYLTPVNKVPMGSVFLVLAMDIIFVCLNLVNETAFLTVTSITVIGFQISYAIPLFLRVTHSKNTFVKKDFNLGRWGYPLGWLSFIWLVITSFLFFLPTTFPVDSANMNYTFVIVGLVATVGSIHWIFSARHWFNGPVTKPLQIVVEEDVKFVE
ncbi:hypothetical protein HK099_004932 [Clydaea vesicula]|uniref:Amino acid transporter n=1 Tax=Clydaea vesicula TaxID=447962 RepID=A0AAD5U319_9FUNG|nr:hypothetical protein HK099_004932 [Clydaea vesicula]